MPKLRSRAGVWYADCYFVDANGTRVRRERSTGVKDDGSAQSRRTAEKSGRDIEAALASGRGRRAGGETLRAAYTERLERLELAGRSASTLDIVGEKSVHVLRFFGPDKVAAEITEDDLREYGAYARTKRAAATVIREFTELRAAAKAIGVELPPSPDVGRPRVVERWVDTEQTRRLLEQASEGKRKHILAYRYLGLSWSELYRIAEPDVDRRAWLVRVRGTKTKDRDRLVPLAAHVRHVFAPGFHFEKWDYGNGNRDMTNWARAAGVVGEGERFSFNDLRRSFATELVRAGVSTKIVAELMGHVDEKMVNRVYARVAVGAHMSAAVAKLESP